MSIQSIDNKKFKVIGHKPIWDDWFMEFKVQDDNHILVSEIAHSTLFQIRNDVVCKYELKDNKIFLFSEKELGPYTWMIYEGEIWVAGQGGAMNFPMIQLGWWDYAYSMFV
jgi:hypothetical protein